MRALRATWWSTWRGLTVCMHSASTLMHSPSTLRGCCSLAMPVVGPVIQSLAAGCTQHPHAAGRGDNPLTWHTLSFDSAVAQLPCGCIACHARVTLSVNWQLSVVLPSCRCACWAEMKKQLGCSGEDCGDKTPPGIVVSAKHAQVHGWGFWGAGPGGRGPGPQF